MAFIIQISLAVISQHHSAAEKPHSMTFASGMLRHVTAEFGFMYHVTKLATGYQHTSRFECAL